MYKSYITLFGEIAKKHANETALVDREGKRKTTYAELDMMRRRVAGKLIAQGVAPGSVILVNMGRCREYMAAYLGVLTAGCIVVAVIPEFPEERIRTIREDCGSNVTLYESFFDDLDKFAAAEDVPVEADTNAMILYTSGSTGKPKGIVHSHRSILRIATGPHPAYDGFDERIVFGYPTSFAFITVAFGILLPLLRGSEIHILSNTTRTDTALIADYFAEHKINMAILPAQLLSHYRNKSPYLRRVITGSELVRDFYSEEFDAYCAYGSSETCMTSEFLIDKKYENTPVGKPFADCEFLLSADGEAPNTEATEGELYVIGDFAHEYLHLPERTAETFIRQPDGRIMFKTGDIMRRLPDGNYQFVSRADWMVKLNGHRVELLEVESVLQHLPGVNSAAVKAFTDDDRQNWLCAYVVMPEDTFDEQKLRAMLAEKLMLYMQPRFIMLIDKMPLTATGKIDRQSLPKPSLDDFRTKYRAPSDEKESALCRAFSAVLECENVGVDDNFFSLGGDSIKVLQLKDMLEKDIRLTFNMQNLFTLGTPAKLALALRPVADVIPHSEVPPVSVPLTETQFGVYLECVENPNSTKYNIPFLSRLPEKTDLDRFACAVEAVFKKHAVIRSVVRMENGAPMLIASACPFSIERREIKDTAKFVSEFVRPFDLENGPLFRFALLKTAMKPVFLLDIHHVVFDGTSLRLFMKQIVDAYNGHEIPEERITQFDVSTYEIKLKETDTYREAQEFFRERFEGTEFNAGLTPDKAEKTASVITPCIDIAAPAELNPAKVLYRVRSLGVTENTLFMSAFAYALSVFRAENEVFFSTVDNGRRHISGLADSVGMFVKSLPLKFTIPENATSQDFLKDVRKILISTMEHDCISFGELARNYGANLTVSFVYQGELLSEVFLEGEAVLPEPLPTNDCQSDILCMLLKNADGYNIHISYTDKLYSEEFIRSFAETVFAIAKGLLVDGELRNIPLLSERQTAFINDFNRTEKPYDPEETVQQLIAKSIAAYPEQTALVYKERSYTYAEFDRITRAIAAKLHAAGVKADDYIAVYGYRDDLTVLSAWGVIRAGACVQLLDPTYPAERLNYMVSDSKARLLISDRELRSILTDYTGEVLYMDEITSLPAADIADIVYHPNDALAMIYTSGTTGKPKGCTLENHNMVAFFHNHRRVMEITANSRVAQYASFGFDAGLMDIISIFAAGAAMYIVPDEIRLDILGLDAFFCDNGITHGFMTTQVGRMFALETKCKTLHHFNVGGEKLVPLTPPESIKFINCYGPCETSVYICSHRVTDNSPIQPIGKPNDNIKLYISDKAGRLLPAGAIGELCIAGLQVGRGYLGLPEKTAEVFTQNPYSDDPDFARMYKSGDFARLLPSGEIDFIGRRDGQVKIRGFRVETTEVEEVIHRYPGIEDTTVAAFDDAREGKYLAAYVVSKENIDPEKIAAFIRAEKPDYMVPAVIMQLDAIPYTQNQKVNKRALPKPVRTQSAAEKVLPQTKTEEKVYAIAAGILGHEDFGITTDLFAAGLTSISSLRFNVDLANAFETAVRISDIRENSTVQKLAAFFDKTHGEVASIRKDVSDYPLLRNQEGVFLDANADKENLRYNIPVLLRISEKLDVEKLRDAVCAAINAHPMIKATLKSDESGSVRMVRHDEEAPEVAVIRYPKLPEISALVKPFAMLEHKLYRATLVVTDDGNYLFLDIHHIVADGTSLAILLRDIGAAYEGKALAQENYTGFEAALDEEALLATEKYDAAMGYYDTLLASCNTESTPGKCPEKDAKCASAVLTRAFDGGSEEIKRYCDAHHITANAFFNAVFGFVLAKFLHADDVTYCTVYNGRNDSRLAEAFAMLVKTLPVRFMLPQGDVLSCVESMQKQLLDTMANDIVAFGDLTHKFGIGSDIFFNYQGDSFVFDNIAGEKAEPLPITGMDAKAPLAFEVFLKNGVFSIDCTYRPDMYCKEFASSITDAVICAAKDFAQKELLQDVSLLFEREDAYFAEMNATDTPFEKIPAQRMFERYAAQHPDKIAAKSSEASLTFGEMDRLANAVANALREMGAESGEIIGMISDRNVYVPVMELGIMKAGCAFLPMLPTYPDERLAYCMKDAKCRFAISSRDIISNRQELFAQDAPYRALAIEELIKGNGESAPDIEISQDQLVYCIYTSGSTGTPKGVMLEHHNLSCFAQTAGIKETIDAGNVVLCMASISFDMSLSEIHFSLSHGKTIYIATENEIHNPDLLLKAFLKEQIDTVFMTPSFAWSLLSMPDFEQAFRQIKGITLGAEAFRPVLLAKLKSLNPDMVIQNGYGPTECTQACSSKTLHVGDEITIGKPFPNMKYYVVDENSMLLPRYAMGELMICGENVCRGYVGLPEKNAAAFTEIRGVRAYHSGDLVRINRDNEAEFTGRADNQVKLRGFRVELDEVEAVMQEFPGVTQSKVIVRNNGTEDFLAGFFTATEAIDIALLTEFMKTKLTYYMVPAAMMQLDKMPMTPNGKLDKKALPDIKPVQKVRAKRAPKKSLEERILEMFREALNIQECYVDDNFFEIGGTSLSASKVVMQLKSAGYKAEYQDIFDHQTAGELAEYLESLVAPTPAAAKDQASQALGDEWHDVLQYNSMEYANEVQREPLGDVLLTGATGFLGIHILKSLLDTEKGHIYCLLRKGKMDSLEVRLKTSLVYYFDDDFAAILRDRVTVLEGDITDEHLVEICKDIHFDTLINCAACVKHYAKDNSIEIVNVKGVENLIKLTKEKQAKMIQISTTSVPGAHNDETYKINLRMPEDRLFVIDDMNNQYARSKYQAELRMLQAIREGMRGKIIRVGNLMGRYSDGEFQTNMHTNAFLSALRGFAAIGKCPVSHCTDPMSYSPIDCTAQAVVLLAGTNDKFTAFNAESRSVFDEMKVMDALNRCGISIKPVPDEEFYADFRRMMGDPAQSEKLSALLTNDRPDLHFVSTDNRFTANILYRIGFAWPFIDDAYLEKLFTSLAALDFFYIDL